ncbi:MAG: hypothetical protein GAK45_00156 [Pseudomonas citronellolis]|nr:MAG: hypothetical protein GAK45_00156 [Pseudomonas citronellolis]
MIRENVAAAGGGGSGYSYQAASSFGGGGGAGFNGKGGGNGGGGGGGYNSSGTIASGNGIGADGQSGPLGGKGGSAVGGYGGDYSVAYAFKGGAGAYASNSLGNIGGGGGAAGYGSTGSSAAGKGGNAAGGLAIAAGATVNLANTSFVSNLAAGGGGSAGSSGTAGAVGGDAAGAILVSGTLNYQASSVTFSDNTGAGGKGGAGGNGSGTAADGNSLNTLGVLSGGALDTTYAPPVYPAVSDANISISGATGTGGAFKIGDTITATWNDSASGDNDSSVTGVTFDFSQFGGGSAVTASNNGGVWTATYTLVAGSIDATSRNVSLTATNADGTTTRADTSNATVDNVAPVVTDANVSLSGASQGTRIYVVGDTLTATWNNSGSGDNNSDSIVSVTFDFSAFGGGNAVVATNASGVWTAQYVLPANASLGSNRNVSVSVVDNAGNATVRGDTSNASVANSAPVLDSSQSVSLPTVPTSQTSLPAQGAGTAISDLVGNGSGPNNVSDANAGAVVGIAITSADSSHGIWWYTTDNGSTWINMNYTAVTATQALLLNANSSSRVYFQVTDSAYAGTISNALTFRAWDQTSGAAATRANTTSNGGTSAFSAASDSLSLTIASPNNAPQVTTSSGSAAFVAADNSASTPVAIDSGLTVVDADSSSLSRATVSITGNFMPGEDVLSFTNDGSTMGNITAMYNAATGVLELSSAGNSATVAQWQSALQSVTYVDVAVTPTNATRTISFSINDGSADSNTATRTVTVADTDQTPIVGSSGGTTRYSEGGVPVAVDSGMTVSDLDNTTLESASVSISGNFQSGDELGFTNNGVSMGNISAIYDATNGTLTLSSSGATATLAQWQSALRSVTYSSSSSNLDTSPRSVSFNVSDGTKTSANVTQSIAITALNKAPVNSLPTSQAVDMGSALVFNSANGNLISVSDVDANGALEQITLTATHGLLTLSGTSGLSFIIGSGAGDATMTFQGTLADINAALNGLTFTPNAGYYGAASIQIVSNDLGNSGSGGAQTDTDTLSVTVNSVSPQVSDVSSTNADGTYAVGSSVTLTVTFDQAVTVDTTGGSPSLLLLTGAVDRSATYVSGSGSNTLVFSYTVQAGDSSADLASAGLSLNGASIHNAAGYAATLSLPSEGGAHSLSGNKDLVIDGIAPTVGSVSVPANGTYAIGQNLDFVVNYSENVTVDTSGGTPRLVISLDTGGTVYADYVSGSGSTALTFRLTVANGQLDSTGISVGSSLDSNGGSVRDTAGNAAVALLNGVASTAQVNIDGVPPSATGIALVGASTTNAGNVVFDVEFSETVSGVDSASFALQTTGNATGQILSVVQTGVQSWQVTVGNLAGDGQLSLALNNDSRVHDTAGNALQQGLQGPGYTLDHTSPQVGAVQLPADGRYSIGQTLNFEVDFSEAVVVDTQGGVPRIAITLDQGGTVYANYVSGSGTSHLVFAYTVAAGQADNNGISVGNQILSNGGSLTDVAGNAAQLVLGTLGSTRGLLVQGSVSEGDPQFRVDPGRNPGLPGGPAQTDSTALLPSPLPDSSAPSLGQPPLLDSHNQGAAQSGLSSVFRNPPTQSQLSLIFSNNSNQGFGDGVGFLGFGGGDGGIFASTTLGAVFGAAREGDEQLLSAFDTRTGSIEQGLSGVFRSAGLSQQLNDMNQRDQQHLTELAKALGELGQERPAG